jgi:hypothetical protein
MKSLPITALLVLTMISSVFAGPGNTPHFKGMDHFAKAFPKATMVVCQVKSQFTEVNFTWNDMKLQAFYDFDGNLIGTSRAVAIKDLPLSLLLKIKSDYAGFEPTEAIEFDHTDTGLSYYVTIAGPEKAYVLRLDADGTTSVFKKMKY